MFTRPLQFHEVMKTIAEMKNVIFRSILFDNFLFGFAFIVFLFLFFFLVIITSTSVSECDSELSLSLSFAHISLSMISESFVNHCFFFFVFFAVCAIFIFLPFSPDLVKLRPVFLENVLVFLFYFSCLFVFVYYSHLFIVLPIHYFHLYPIRFHLVYSCDTNICIPMYCSHHL